MDRLILKQNGPISYFIFETLERMDGLVHAYSTRSSGVSPFPQEALNLGYISEDRPANVVDNRSRFLKAIASSDATLLTLHQIHSNQIHILNNDAAKSKGFFTGKSFLDQDPARYATGDGLITVRPGHLLAIQTADCLPIFLIDTKQRVVANLHAGWRGTLAHIVECGVATLRQSFGVQTQDLIAAIGPGIGVCCYEVGDEVAEQFQREFHDADLCLRPSDGSRCRRLDLAGANLQQLLACGLSKNQILQARRCTACEPQWFFSYRREKGITGRMMAVIGLKNS